MAEKNYITPEGYKKLVDELTELATVERPRVVREVSDEEGEAHVYQIVGVDEVDAGQGRISWKSPVGRALIGKRIDDTVNVKWHAGQRELTVAGIRYTPP